LILFLTRFSEKIGRIFWLTNDYLIFNVGDKIKIAEIDSRDQLNVIDLAEFNSPQIFWSQKDGKLYVQLQNADGTAFTPPPPPHALVSSPLAIPHQHLLLAHTT